MLRKPGGMQPKSGRFMERMRVLHNEMITLFGDDTYSDLEITCKGVSFRAHRTILFSRCDFFRACLGTGFKEGQEAVMVLDDDDPTALRMALYDIYTRSPSTVSDNMCADEKTDFNTVIQTWKVADKYELPELALQCLSFISSTEGLNLLKKRSGQKWTEDLLLGLIESKGLSTEIKGSQHNGDIREEIKKILLASKDLTEMSVAEEDIIRTDPDLAVELMKFVLKKPSGKGLFATPTLTASVTVKADESPYIPPSLQFSGRRSRPTALPDGDW